jgi:hypothetical protein
VGGRERHTPGTRDFATDGKNRPIRDTGYW